MKTGSNRSFSLGIFSCDCSQVAAGLESSESWRGLYSQERVFSHMSGTSADMADWAGACFSSPSFSIRLSGLPHSLVVWGQASNMTAGFPQNECFKGVRRGGNTSLDLASEVMWYHFYLTLVSQKPLPGKPRFKGRGIHVGRQGSLGTSLTVFY